MGNNAAPEEVSELIAHLRSVLPHDGTRDALITSVIPKLLQSIADVAQALRSSHHVAAAGTANTFGDDQLNVDVTAENLIRDAITHCPSIVTASSEEDPVERPVQHSAPSLTPSTKEQYTLAFDPLDGSSIIPANWTVGTIISLWDGPTALNQPPSTAQIAAILGVLGPRTTAIVALRIPGSTTTSQSCFELALDPSSSQPTPTWKLTRPTLTLAPQSRYFSPANLRAAADDPAYMALVTDYISRRCTLRYAGGLVPDVVHMLVQGQGVYLSPVTARSRAKLRRLYELCPLALVVECAGGEAFDPVDGGRVLGKEVGGCGETGGLVCGSGEEVREAVGRLVAGRGGQGVEGL
ncbi:Sedoheptulose-1,7-bisphosphatase, chloroplastic [Parachaetomium inaequale]|uniref:Sedoheptulose-1,7-bisphosphatase, chloroplastic n=1 Tax=Parachaetomium inaequale TaxID=2588326 RepID=A0AAN6PNA6_9PEZI|nr:Sedoheptulose-1,7-bisphosphatase, chloroplastic [Parachaetomium inaequale]